MTTTKQIRKYCHPLTISAAINTVTVPWHPDYKSPFDADNVRLAGRTYGELCRMFGAKSVAQAFATKDICICGDAWKLSPDEQQKSGFTFDVSRCREDTPIVAVSMHVG